MSGRILFHKKSTSYQQLEGNLSSLLECGSAFWRSSHFRARHPWTTSCGRACPSPCSRRPRWRSRPSRCPMAWTASLSPFPSHQVWSSLSLSMLITFHNHHVQVIFTLCNVHILYLPVAQICCGATPTLSSPSRHRRPSRPKWRVGYQVNGILEKFPHGTVQNDYSTNQVKLVTTKPLDQRILNC